MAFSEVPFYHYIMMAVGWPSIAVYGLLIMAVVKGRKRQSALRSSFYIMIIAQGVPCIILFFYMELLVKTRKYGYFQPFVPQLHSTLVQFTYFGHQLLRNTIIFSLIPFAANRYTAVKQGARYMQIWSSRTTFLCIAIYWCTSAAVAAPTLFHPTANLSFVPNAYKDGLGLWVDDDTLNLDAYASSAVLIVTFIICSLLYSLAFGSLLSKKMRDAVDLKMARSDEILLLFSSAITFSTLIFDLLDNVITVIATNTASDAILGISYDMWFLTTQVLCITPPWSLLCTSAMMRRHFLRLLGCPRLAGGKESRASKLSRTERGAGTTVTRSITRTANA